MEEREFDVCEGCDNEQYVNEDGFCETCEQYDWAECVECGYYVITDDLNAEMECADCEKYCDDCNNLLTSNNQTEFENACYDCVDSCRECGRETPVAQGQECYNCGSHLCEGCGSTCPCGDIYCEDCISWCESCCENVCGETFHCYECSEFMCEYCYENHSCVSEIEGVHHYGYQPDLIFTPRNTTSPYGYMGIELEFETNNMYNIQEAVWEVENITDLVYFKEDSSLMTGVELVTHPMTFDYAVNDFEWDDIMDKIGRNSLDVEASCGMHVHISRSRFTSRKEDRLIEVLHNLKTPLMKLSERLGGYSSYAKWNTSAQKLTPEIIAVAKDSRNRYKAINFQNSGTLEFRFFAGTVCADTVRMRLDVIDALTRIAVGTCVIPTNWKDFTSYLSRAESVTLANEVIAEAEVL